MNDDHLAAQELSALAATALAEGRTAEAQSIYSRAADHESAALALVSRDKSRTRNVLSISLVALLYKSMRLDEAERAIFGFLAAGDLEQWAETSLRDLLSVVSDERLLLAGSSRRYTGESIVVSLRGGEIGAGTGPLDLVLEKASALRSLLYRAAEWAGKFPMRHQGPPPKGILDLIQARASEPAVGSYRLEIRLTEPVQADLFNPPRVEPGMLADSLFAFLRCVSRGTPEELSVVVPQPEYRKALLQLTRNILPRGKRIQEVGIYRKGLGHMDSVYLTEAVSPLIRAAIPRDEVSTDERVSADGTLRALHLDKNWLELTLQDGTHMICDTVPEMLDDVVGPMVNHAVHVTGRRRMRRGRDRVLVDEIELRDEE